jgi:hypothetical protein
MTTKAGKVRESLLKKIYVVTEDSRRHKENSLSQKVVNVTRSGRRRERSHVPVFVEPVRASCFYGIVIVALTVFDIDLYN